MPLTDLSDLTPLEDIDMDKDESQEAPPASDLTAAIAFLAQTLATPTPVSAPSTKLREPDTFDGADPNKLRTVLLQFGLHFLDHAHTFSDDGAKVAYTLSFLAGPAL